MKLGYARVSTVGQKIYGSSLESQIEELEKAGCERIFTDAVSGASLKREGLDDLLNVVREGDSIVVCKLDRFSRSLGDLVSEVVKLDELGVSLVSLAENVNTSSSSGRLMLHLMGAFAEFERERIKERTWVGLQKARDNGVKMGPKFSYGQREIDLVKLVNSDPTYIDLSVKDKINYVGVSRSVYYRILDSLKVGE